MYLPCTTLYVHFFSFGDYADLWMLLDILFLVRETFRIFWRAAVPILGSCGWPQWFLHRHRHQNSIDSALPTTSWIGEICPLQFFSNWQFYVGTKKSSCIWCHAFDTANGLITWEMLISSSFQLLPFMLQPISGCTNHRVSDRQNSVP